MQFEGSVEENTADVEVMRLKANDLDEPKTNNSLAKFEIVSGNSGGHFRIYTDPKTNEGVLVLTKVSRPVLLHITDGIRIDFTSNYLSNVFYFDHTY